MKRRKMIMPLTSLMMLSTLLVGCQKNDAPQDSGSEPKDVQPNSSQPEEEKVAVKEVILTLSKDKAKVGDVVSATVTIKPTNATDKTFTLVSDDDTVAKVNEENKIECIKGGSVTITARSKSNASKYATAKLTVLGTDDQGRLEYIFEAEDANIVAAEDSAIKSEQVSDDRLSGTGVVGSLSKNDRIIFGVNANEADDNALLSFKLMGPSGWLGYWDSIDYNFSDWYTIKVNGKIVDTESIHITGTANAASNADYYNVQDVEIGKISLKAGLNIITFVISNRYDQTSINKPSETNPSLVYNGTISCWGNIDCMSIKSSKELEEETDKSKLLEVEGADEDVKYLRKATTFGTNVKAFTLSNKTFTEVASYSPSIAFSSDMKILSALSSENAAKLKVELEIENASENGTNVKDEKLSDILSLSVNEKDVDISSVLVKSNKGEYSSIVTSWIDITAGVSTFELNIKDRASYNYLGSLKSLTFAYITGEFEFSQIETPAVISSYTFEAEANETVRVGYDSLDVGATYVQLKNSYKVETEKYKNKIETTQVIFGVEFDKDTTATITLRVSSPYVTDAAIEDVGLGSLGDLFVNGKMVSTPATIKGCEEKNKKDNFSDCTIAAKINLRQGKNRISWEPNNYLQTQFDYMGGLDKITLDSSANLTAYKVNFWTDRHTYMDDFNTNAPEEIKVYWTNPINEATKDSEWVAVYRENEDYTTVGSIYYAYPTNVTYGANNWTEKDGVKSVNILSQNKTDKTERTIGIEPNGNGGMIRLVYFTNDSARPYQYYDDVLIGVWNDPDQYGGYVTTE